LKSRVFQSLFVATRFNQQARSARLLSAQVRIETLAQIYLLLLNGLPSLSSSRPARASCSQGNESCVSCDIACAAIHDSRKWFRVRNANKISKD